MFGSQPNCTFSRPLAGSESLIAAYLDASKEIVKSAGIALIIENLGVQKVTRNNTVPGSITKRTRAQALRSCLDNLSYDVIRCTFTPGNSSEIVLYDASVITEDPDVIKAMHSKVQTVEVEINSAYSTWGAQLYLLNSTTPYFNSPEYLSSKASIIIDRPGSPVAGEFMFVGKCRRQWTGPYIDRQPRRRDYWNLSTFLFHNCGLQLKRPLGK